MCSIFIELIKDFRLIIHCFNIAINLSKGIASEKLSCSYQENRRSDTSSSSSESESEIEEEIAEEDGVEDSAHEESNFHEKNFEKDVRSNGGILENLISSSKSSLKEENDEEISQHSKEGNIYRVVPELSDQSSLVSRSSFEAKKDFITISTQGHQLFGEPPRSKSSSDDLSEISEDIEEDIKAHVDADSDAEAAPADFLIKASEDEEQNSFRSKDQFEIQKNWNEFEGENSGVQDALLEHLGEEEEDQAPLIANSDFLDSQNLTSFLMENEENSGYSGNLAGGSKSHRVHVEAKISDLGSEGKN